VSKDLPLLWSVVWLTKTSLLQIGERHYQENEVPLSMVNFVDDIDSAMTSPLPSAAN
jgi:hypothetical protein